MDSIQDGNDSASDMPSMGNPLQDKALDGTDSMDSISGDSDLGEYEI